MTDTGCAVWLYGSHARGVTDCRSDVDVLIVGDLNVNLAEIQPKVSLRLSTASLSRYTWNEISGMAAYGSLFLHHLKQEAYPLYETPSNRGALQAVLDGLGDYAHAERDLASFRTVLDDVEDALVNDQTRVFELSVLGTVIRHCSILGCWLLENPLFGRMEPVYMFVRARGLDERITKEFLDLYQYRLYIDGRVDRASLTRIEAYEWLGRARHIVSEAEDLVYEHHR